MYSMYCNETMQLKLLYKWNQGSCCLAKSQYLRAKPGFVRLGRFGTANWNDFWISRRWGSWMHPRSYSALRRVYYVFFCGQHRPALLICCTARCILPLTATAIAIVHIILHHNHILRTWLKQTALTTLLILKISAEEQAGALPKITLPAVQSRRSHGKKCTAKTS